MTRDESRTLAITAGVLFLAGGVRAGLEVMRPPLAIHADTVSAQALATTSREMLDEEERRSAPLAPGERIDPNTAAEEELDRLPGIGPATVDRLRPHLAFETSGGGRPVRRGAAGARPATAPGGASPVNPQDAIPMDLNRATAEELEDVRGIGPALAARIIARRDEVGGFTRVEDLIQVRGIGPVMLETIRSRLFVRP